MIDAIGVDKASGEVVLTVSDHLGWEDEASHLEALQSKLNRYLAFLESGEVFSQYPAAVGRTLRILVVLKYPPPDLADQFFRRARTTTREAGFELDYRVLPDAR